MVADYYFPIIDQFKKSLLSKMWIVFIFSCVLSLQCAAGQFGESPQAFSYVEVRPGAHMFYWVFFTTADVGHYTERPLIVWLQGGPGGSSTGIGNFEIMGPLDLELKERNYTWVKDFNVLYLDNPVGTGFSYCESLTCFTRNNEQIADDFVNLMSGFYKNQPEFEGVPLYIFGQSYGGKMAVDMGLKIHEAQKEGRIKSNIKGVAMGNAWISPLDSTLTWAPLLLTAGLADQAGYEDIMNEARQCESLFNEGKYTSSTNAWSKTQSAVFRATKNVDFYDILHKMSVKDDDTRSEITRARDLMINDGYYPRSSSKQELSLDYIMNELVKPKLGISENVIWGGQSGAVWSFLEEDFMKPVTQSIERLLNETDIIVMKYNGNLDLICNTPGQLQWMDRLQWSGAEAYKASPRHPIWENGKLEGYYKSYGNLRFFWVNMAGHSVPRDNPAASRAFLRDMTSF